MRILNLDRTSVAYVLQKQSEQRLARLRTAYAVGNVGSPCGSKIALLTSHAHNRTTSYGCCAAYGGGDLRSRAILVGRDRELAATPGSDRRREENPLLSAVAGPGWRRRDPGTLPSDASRIAKRPSLYSSKSSATSRSRATPRAMCASSSRFLLALPANRTKDPRNTRNLMRAPPRKRRSVSLSSP